MHQLVLKIVLLAAVAAVASATRPASLRRPSNASAASDSQATGPSQLKVFLDCDGCYSDFLQSEIEFVDYVRDRTEAEVHVSITRAQTGSGGGEYTLAFMGRGRFADVTETLKTVTESSDTDDIVRRQLADLGARRPAAIPDARRRAAAAGDRGEARHRAAAACRRRRPLEQLGVQPARARPRSRARSRAAHGSSA